MVPVYLREDPQRATVGAARTDGPPSELVRFMERFSDAQLAILWKWSGLGFDPATQEAAPYPGREVMVKFIEPIPGSWRDILRRAVRNMGNRRDLLALLSLLRQIVTGYVPPVPHSAPAPRVLTPQRGCHRIAPARAP
ncbi:hypothetical protein [Streptomyces violascens]|uniref:Uncharacterized protein n=1 Tax=Streptomyces violascens TaxID=67381 RepID=A0ABQ3QQZ0_9ACTN|nr:hypothetical protein [Streptomyces violascens]GHI39697.1 hypothetical protein Sviol_41050 [Streptomyces violascens]